MITSIHNPAIADAVSLKRHRVRERTRRFLLEGAPAVGEALGRPGTVQQVFVTAGGGRRIGSLADRAHEAGVRVTTVSADVMRTLSTTVTPQGVVAVAGFVDAPLADVRARGGVIPVLVEVRDPGNAGTIIRSADAAGADALVFTTGSVDVYNPKVVRSSAGSLFHLPVVREVDLRDVVDQLRRGGAAILAATADGERSLHDVDLSTPTAVLFGNEANGLSADDRALADAGVRVPIRGLAESLNLAVAASVILFEAARQREPAGEPVTGAASTLLAAGAHDLRSPLTAIRAFASTLAARGDRLDPGTRRDILAAIEADALRGNRMITRLLEAARLAEGNLDLVTRDVDLTAAADDAVAEADSPGGPVVELDAPTAVPIHADPDRVRTIVAALIDVAAWYGREGPVVVTVRGGDPATLVVSRGGDGSAPDLVASTRALEFVVAGGLARSHGGSLMVAEDPHTGVRLEVRLPRAGRASAAHRPSGGGDKAR